MFILLVLTFAQSTKVRPPVPFKQEQPQLAAPTWILGARMVNQGLRDCCDRHPGSVTESAPPPHPVGHFGVWVGVAVWHPRPLANGIGGRGVTPGIPFMVPFPLRGED